MALTSDIETTREGLIGGVLRWVERGFPVLPLTWIDDTGRCSCGHRCGDKAGKHPRISGGRDFAAATTDEKLIREWWGAWPRANIGIPTGGRTGLLVIDVDTEGDQWQKAEFVTRYGIDAAAVIVKTGSGGRHYWFARPDVPGRLSHGGQNTPFGIQGVHLRADGGLVVVPPSRTAAGPYTLLEAKFDELAPPHPELVDLLLNRQKPQRTAPARGETIREGARNTALTSLGGAMRRRGMTETEIASALLAVNVKRCDPPLEEHEVRGIARSLARYEPVGTADPVQDELTDAERRILALPRTDAGNGEALACFYGHRLRYDHKRGRWLIFREHHWQPDRDGELIRLCKRLARLRHAAALKVPDKGEREAACSWARSTESRAKIDAALTLARAESPIADKGEDWDADSDLLGVPNGVIELRTGTLRDGRPEDRITQIAAVRFDPEATCPRWERFLREVLSDDEELIGFVQRGLGYSATGSMRERCFFVCFGAGGNGKSVLLGQVRSVLGDLAADIPFTTFELSARSGIPADLAALDGKRFITASETSEHTRLNEARLKAWTGQDPCTARLLHENFRTFQPVGKIWLCTNHRPRVEDDSEGFWQRVRLIPFRRQFRPEDEPDLADTLQAEAPGILRWLVEGAKAWLEGGLRAPASVLAASDEWRTEADPLTEFIEARCECGPEAWARSGELYAAYSAWAQAEGLRDRERLSATAFGRRMGARFARQRTKTGRVYDGVGLRVTG